jgi:hypothetical protein
MKEDAESYSGYRGPELLHLIISLQDGRSFIEQPKGSNSTKQLLSEVNWQTRMRFLIRFKATRTLLRRSEEAMSVEPVETTGSKFPLPTTIDEGKDGGVEEE